MSSGVQAKRWAARLEAVGARPGDGAATAEIAECGIDISPVWESPAAERLAPGHRRDAALRHALQAADFVAAFAALTLVVALSTGGERPRLAVLALGPIAVLAAKALGLYDRDQHILRRTTIDEVPSIVHLSVLYTLTVWLAEALLLRGWLDRRDVFELLVAAFALFTGGRAAVRAVAAATGAPERCLILGNELDAARIGAKLNGAAGLRALVVGRAPLQARGSGGALASVIAEQRVDRVVVVPDGHDQDDVLQAIRLIKAIGVKVSVVPRLLEVVGSAAAVDEVEGLTLLAVRHTVPSPSSEALKRLMDVVLAAAGLVVLAPVLAIVAVAIRLDTPGPVFFGQGRIGRHGQRFRMLKFRSMIVGADEIKDELRGSNEVQGGLFKIADDPRITRVGRVLRRASLDELPQLFNVLAGSMSLVGPRPLVQDEDALIEGWQRRRLAYRPGMTGMWQIFGSSRIPMQEMVKIDYLYGANWSIWLDLKILLGTVPYMLRRQGM